MSLKEELSALQASEKRKKEQEEAIARLPFSIVCSQYPLSETDKALLKEAVELINPKKWESLRYYTENDMHTEINRSGFHCKFPLMYFKVMYNGECLLGSIGGGDNTLSRNDAKHFFGSKCKAFSSKVLIKNNQRVADTQAYLLGAQEYVVLANMNYGDDLVVLFRDGTLFKIGHEISWNESYTFKIWLLDRLKAFSD